MIPYCMKLHSAGYTTDSESEVSFVENKNNQMNPNSVNSANQNNPQSKNNNPSAQNKKKDQAQNKSRNPEQF